MNQDMESKLDLIKQHEAALEARRTGMEKMKRAVKKAAAGYLDVQEELQKAQRKASVQRTSGAGVLESLQLVAEAAASQAVASEVRRRSQVYAPTEPSAEVAASTNDEPAHKHGDVHVDSHSLGKDLMAPAPSRRRSSTGLKPRGARRASVEQPRPGRRRSSTGVKPQGRRRSSVQPRASGEAIAAEATTQPEIKVAAEPHSAHPEVSPSPQAPHLSFSRSVGLKANTGVFANGTRMDPSLAMELGRKMFLDASPAAFKSAASRVIMKKARALHDDPGPA